MKVRELIKVLERNGWSQVRMRGSHRQFRHGLRRGTVTVSGHLGEDIPPGTLSSVLKQAGLKKEVA
jgi:predicted RNA binding protein YcfA (HicA-like mRNA interferase family)